ncbi:MAG: HAMP domain-containing sensor histidine kinase [Cyanobacteria bacterium J06632_22]
MVDHVTQFLPTISSLVALGEFLPETVAEPAESISALPETVRLARQAQRAEGEWQAAIASVRHLLKQTLPDSPSDTEDYRGILLSGPVPVLDVVSLTTPLSNWTFVPQSREQLLRDQFAQLMPADRAVPEAEGPAARLLPLFEGDPLTAERFCLLLTTHFNLVLVLGRDANQEMHFQFSFTPAVIESVWQLLRSRIAVVQSAHLATIDALVTTFTSPAPDHRWVSQFTRLMLSALPATPLPVEERPRSQPGAASVSPAHGPQPQQGTHTAQGANQASPGLKGDLELLKAMAHEISTPLTTIRTYTRSLLRRKDLDGKAVQRLRQIDRECTQQINRFGLIFKAVELEAATHAAPRSPLTATPLAALFEEAIPQWQQAATRRGLALSVNIPEQLPMVASDPNMLQQVLTGLVELFTHSVSTASHIDLQVMAAGDQLKLQFQAHQSGQPVSRACPSPSLKSLGHLLMFQPETGGLSLNLSATKTLFQALGAKLTVRDKADQGSTWTVFLPIETTQMAYPIV